MFKSQVIKSDDYMDLNDAEIEVTVREGDDIDEIVDRVQRGKVVLSTKGSEK